MESLRRKPILLLLCCLLALGFASMVLADEDEPVLGKMKTPQTAVPTPAHSFAVPANDECTGAFLIPDGATGAADYPVCSPITTSVLEATPPYDTPSATDPASCLAAGQFVSNTVWYTWTPTVSQYYMLFMCSGTSCSNQTTRTTASDSVLSLYSSTGGCGGTFTLLDCNDDGCGAAGPSRIGPFLATAGTTYYIAAGNWSNGTASAGAVNQVEIRIEVATPPPNDNCTGAEALQLNTPVPGVMNALTNNDFQLSGTACYNQGQIGTTAANQVSRDRPRRRLLLYSSERPGSTRSARSTSWTPPPSAPSRRSCT